MFESRKQEVDVGAFALMVKPAADKPGNRASGEPVDAYVGTLKWTEPFTTDKPRRYAWRSTRGRSPNTSTAASSSARRPGPRPRRCGSPCVKYRAGCTIR